MTTAICPQCSYLFEIIPGHRRRRYCSDRCKQTAYRRRRGQQPQQQSAQAKEMEKKVERIQKMKRQWPEWDFGTYYLLAEIEHKHGTALAIKVAECIKREVNQALNNRNV